MSPLVRNQPTTEAKQPSDLQPVRSLHLRVGEAGEAAALQYLRDQGFRILACDWRSRLGQIDIVAEDGGTLVIVEVKARTGTGFGRASEAVDARKQAKLRVLTTAYQISQRRQTQAVRIDVIGLLLGADLTVRSIEHIRNAVGG